MTRDAHTDPLDELRALTTRMRSLLDDARTRYPGDVPPLPAPRTAVATSAGAAPRTGDDAYQPRDPEAASPIGTPSFLDEEGEENALPLEFATATMGHVLLGQGRPDAARAIFLAVLERSPDDGDARRGLALLGEGANTDDRAPVPLLDRADPPAGYGALSVRALPVDPSTITVFWELTAELATTSALTLCVVSLRAGIHGDIERSERRAGGIAPTGERFVHGLPAGAEHHVALGVERDGAFVPLAHATAVRTPRGAPSDRDALERATLTPPTGATPARITAVHGSGAIRAAGRTGAAEVFDEARLAWMRQGPRAPSSP